MLQLLLRQAIGVLPQGGGLRTGQGRWQGFGVGGGATAPLRDGGPRSVVGRQAGPSGIWGQWSGAGRTAHRRKQFVFCPRAILVQGTQGRGRLGCWCRNGWRWLQPGILGRILILVGRSRGLLCERFQIVPKGRQLCVLYRNEISKSL